MHPSTFALLLVASLCTLVNAIHFELHAVTNEHLEEGTKCFSQYVPHDTLVLAVVNVGEGYNQHVNLEVRMNKTDEMRRLMEVDKLVQILDDSETPNIYVKKKDISGELRNAFNTNKEGEVYVCFENVLDNGNHMKFFFFSFLSNIINIGFKDGPQYKRTIELQFSVGAEAADFKKIASAEKLSPLELELRKLETVVSEIVDEMNYLKRREAKLRDTNGNLLKI